MNKILIETVNLKKTYQHYNGSITLFNNLNLFSLLTQEEKGSESSVCEEERSSSAGARDIA